MEQTNKHRVLFERLHKQARINKPGRRCDDGDESCDASSNIKREQGYRKRCINSMLQCVRSLVYTSATQPSRQTGRQFGRISRQIYCLLAAIYSPHSARSAPIMIMTARVTDTNLLQYVLTGSAQAHVLLICANRRSTRIVYIMTTTSFVIVLWPAQTTTT